MWNGTQAEAITSISVVTGGASKLRKSKADADKEEEDAMGPAVEVVLARIQGQILWI